MVGIAQETLGTMQRHLLQADQPYIMDNESLAEEQAKM